MYCPQCRVEYRDGFTMCSDCRADLVPVLPPEIPETAESHPEPVLVFESTDRFAISLAKGSLEDAGIPYWLQGSETDTRLIDAAMFPACRFLVAPDREAEARELLAPLESPIEGQENLSPEVFE